MEKRKAKLNNKEQERKGFWLRLWKLLAPSQRQIKILFALTMVFELVRLISPYLLKLIIDKLTHFDLSDIMPIVILIFFMLIAEQLVSFIDYFIDKRILKTMGEVENYLPVAAQKKLVYLSLSYHEKENTGSKIVKIERGTQKIIELFSNMSWEVVPTIAQLFVTLIALFIVDFRFGLSFMLFAPLFIYVTFKVNKDLYPIRKKRHKDYESSFGKMGQSIININTVKSFVQEKKEVKDYKLIRDAIKENFFTEFSKLLNYSLIRNFIISLGRIAILLLGVYLVWQGNVSIGTLVFVITLSEKSYFSLYRLSRFYDKMEEGKEAVNRFTKLLNQEQDIVNPKNGIKPKDIAGRIDFKNVNFSYESDSGKALGNVNLKINSGCVTALVGPSGGGKTTVARMIYRHYDPQAGEVLLDGQNLKDYDLYAFRKFIAIVPQEVEVFNSSVRDNIAYARPDASFREIKAAAKIANAEEFIDKLTKGYDTEVGERGIKLSGGQRQRLGIARAILANPRILIFDEATSSLDSYSEKLIQDAMEKVGKGRTMIIIAHRLSTIRKADKIIVLEEGNVVEQGSHYELAKASGGLYAKLLKLQEMGDVE
ncbi:MAG: ABC transporter ATP-binding protein [Candidatus Falkowbacteria bacterium]